MTNVKVERKTVPDKEEMEAMIKYAKTIKNEYFRLRALATIAYLMSGKRKTEIANLLVDDHKLEKNRLLVTFSAKKTRSKELFATQRTKEYSLESELAYFILDYLYFLREKVHTEFVYPKGQSSFGSYIFYKDEQADPKTVYRIVKEINPQSWTHLFRERKAVEIIREDERRFGRASIETVYKIMRALDLKDERSAWRYIRRHEVQKVEQEPEKPISL